MLKACLIGYSLSLLIAGAVLAEGDAANGEKVFKRCAACHVANAPPNRVGLSLQGVFGRTAGTIEGFKYSKSMIQHGKDGLVWSAETIGEYIENPKDFHCRRTRWPSRA